MKQDAAKMRPLVRSRVSPFIPLPVRWGEGFQFRIDDKTPSPPFDGEGLRERRSGVYPIYNSKSSSRPFGMAGFSSRAGERGS
jgi:hypothetical protein